MYQHRASWKSIVLYYNLPMTEAINLNNEYLPLSVEKVSWTSDMVTDIETDGTLKEWFKRNTMLRNSDTNIN